MMTIWTTMCPMMLRTNLLQVRKQNEASGLSLIQKIVALSLLYRHMLAVLPGQTEQARGALLCQALTLQSVICFRAAVTVSLFRLTEFFSLELEGYMVYT